jgi:hypothetical protein
MCRGRDRPRFLGRCHRVSAVEHDLQCGRGRFCSAILAAAHLMHRVACVRVLQLNVNTTARLTGSERYLHALWCASPCSHTLQLSVRAVHAGLPTRAAASPCPVGASSSWRGPWTPPPSGKQVSSSAAVAAPEGFSWRVARVSCRHRRSVYGQLASLCPGLRSFCYCHGLLRRSLRNLQTRVRVCVPSTLFRNSALPQLSSCFLLLSRWSQGGESAVCRACGDTFACAAGLR